MWCNTLKRQCSCLIEQSCLPLFTQRDQVQELHTDPAEWGVFTRSGPRSGCQGVETESECPALLLRCRHPLHCWLPHFLPTQRGARWGSRGPSMYLHKSFLNSCATEVSVSLDPHYVTLQPVKCLFQHVFTSCSRNWLSCSNRCVWTW